MASKDDFQFGAANLSDDNQSLHDQMDQEDGKYVHGPDLTTSPEDDDDNMVLQSSSDDIMNTITSTAQAYSAAAAHIQQAAPPAPPRQPQAQQPQAQQPPAQQPHAQQPHVQQPHAQQPHTQQPHTQQPHAQSSQVDQMLVESGQQQQAQQIVSSQIGSPMALQLVQPQSMHLGQQQYGQQQYGQQAQTISSFGSDANAQQFGAGASMVPETTFSDLFLKGGTRSKKVEQIFIPQDKDNTLALKDLYIQTGSKNDESTHGTTHNIQDTNMITMGASASTGLDLTQSNTFNEAKEDSTANTSVQAPTTTEALQAAYQKMQRYGEPNDTAIGSVIRAAGGLNEMIKSLIENNGTIQLTDQQLQNVVHIMNSMYH